MAYERCAALLVREFGIYKVTNGQFIFPFPSTANSYNGAAAALDAAANRIADLEHERASLSRSSINGRTLPISALWNKGSPRQAGRYEPPSSTMRIIAGQIIVVEQDAVLQSLMPARKATEAALQRNDAKGH